MLAKAAASASVPAMKGSVYLDSHDVKIIQYKAAIYKLGETSRLLNLLQKNLEKTADTEIIPLMNYILSLGEGPMFNVHPVLRKRYQLLCEYKVCKVTAVNPALSTSGIDLEVELPEVPEDLDDLKCKIYDENLQWKLLECFQKIVANSSSIYERKLRQVQMERNAKRPVDASGRPITFVINSVENLLRPWEMSLSLDLAVLINSREQDTTTRSLRKLQTQVLSKFTDCLQKKVLPLIRGYYSQIQKFAATRGISETALKELQSWECSIHRVYALLFRTLCLFDVMVSLVRQIYLPNKSYLNESRTMLLSSNVYSYQEEIQKMEALCNLEEHETFGELLAILRNFSKEGSIYHVQPSKVLDVYNNSLSKVIPFLTASVQSLKIFAGMWKYIESNSEANKKLVNWEESQLIHMVEERLAVDKLAHVEQIKQKRSKNEAGLSLKGNSPTSRNAVKRNLIERVNGSSESSISSSGPGSPGKMSPLRMSRTSSIEKGSATSSNLSSPQVSRRGSIAESRVPALAKTSNDKKMALKPATLGKRVIGRPRSSSLQSSQETDQKPKPFIASSLRSNSLQANASLNQRIIQNAVAHSLNGNGTGPSPSARVRNAEKPSPVRCQGPAKTQSQSPIPVPELETLSLNSLDDQICQEHSIDGPTSVNSSTATPEVIVSIKKVRFTGVPPMDEDEDKSPTRRGWYKKPSVLHYPPPPPQFALQKYKMRQEGMAFKTSLREGDSCKKTGFLTNKEIPSPKESSTSKLASKIRDKLR